MCLLLEERIATSLEGMRMDRTPWEVEGRIHGDLLGSNREFESVSRILASPLSLGECETPISRNPLYLFRVTNPYEIPA